MRATYRIRRLPQDRVIDGRHVAAPFQVQRRIAGLFWREIALCSDLDTASWMLQAAVRARRLASLKPRLIAHYGADGQELS
ncbi:hypothetical protein [Burkholderia multivorans]|uniref:hypothetical protein n=1 Tax=Burkholderia multivorans TaxID=87883 RepID=UPI000CFE4B7F|nr:hypothetical protein [Burkholderia multivorans]MBU9261729.1 hypothetical protein [Burkholderia multivorans]MCO1383307.1 hypothetical protein [Burkholderia multivorans]MCO1403712.1 hypothetical protein [Burkholderia multivorans]MDN7942153.1 hypothetical protein [Burkholderia multivorans]PRG93761.1 hypothetical protein C6V04_12515 [Burkholderia multivorans]